MNSDLYVQFGAGLCGPEQWKNFDVSPSLRLQRLPLVGAIFQRVGPKFPRTVIYGDIVKGLPLAAGSADAIYSSHVLEHLSLSDFKTALRNVFTTLRPGGVFRFVLPDLEYLATQYVNDKSEEASHRFMRDAHLGVNERKRGIKGIVRNALGNSLHLWMWDFQSMAPALRATGFVNVRRAQYGDSGDPMFSHVEEEGRWTNCLGMHCNKP